VSMAERTGDVESGSENKGGPELCVSHGPGVSLVVGSWHVPR